MKNTHTVAIENVFNIEYGRKWALRKCTNEDLRLHVEFMNNYFRRDMTTDEYSETANRFIKEKGLRIINEKPVVRTKDDRYVVDVYYTITW